MIKITLLKCSKLLKTLFEKTASKENVRKVVITLPNPNSRLIVLVRYLRKKRYNNLLFNGSLIRKSGFFQVWSCFKPNDVELKLLIVRPSKLWRLIRIVWNQNSKSIKVKPLLVERVFLISPFLNKAIRIQYTDVDSWNLFMKHGI